MNRAQLLAAEIFGYSFINYADHLGIGNVRYERLMPEMQKRSKRLSGKDGLPAKSLRRLR